MSASTHVSPREYLAKRIARLAQDFTYAAEGNEAAARGTTDSVRQAGYGQDAQFERALAAEAQRVADGLTKDAGSDSLPAATAIVGEVLAERRRQLSKWGEQHREDGSDPRTYGPIAARSRQNFLDAEEHGGATWHRAINGPFFEAVSETDPAKLRGVLIELAATCVAWIEDIDSRTEADA